jgi:hypothetical protein
MPEAVAKGAAVPEAVEVTLDKIAHWAAAPANWSNNKTVFISGGMI